MFRLSMNALRLRVRVEWVFRKWDRFWFQLDAHAQLKIFRVAIGFLLFLYFGTRLFDLELYYSPDGVLPFHLVENFGPVKYTFGYKLWGLIPHAHWVFGLLSLGASASLGLGFMPRVSALVVFLCHIAFSQRNPMLLYGFDKVVAFFLISLVLGTSTRRAPIKGSLSARLTSLAVRLGQVQLAVVYVFSGLEKLKGQMWWRGESIWAVLANRQMALFDFSWTSDFPLMLTVANYGTLVWEIYFVSLVWRRSLTYPVLIGGVLLHGGIAFTMGLPYFASGMVFAYAFFLRPEHARFGVHYCAQLAERIFRKNSEKRLQVSAQSSDPISV
jgi:hypothetical protein